MKLTTDRHKASRGLSATTVLLVKLARWHETHVCVWISATDDFFPASWRNHFEELFSAMCPIFPLLLRPNLFQFFFDLSVI